MFGPARFAISTFTWLPQGSIAAQTGALIQRLGAGDAPNASLSRLAARQQGLDRGPVGHPVPAAPAFGFHGGSRGSEASGLKRPLPLAQSQGVGAMENVAAYGVAQNLALGPALFGSAFVPALVAAFSYRAARGDLIGARALSGQALRAGFLMLGLTLLLAGAAPGLIELLFGARYAAAAPLFALLIVAAGAALLTGLAIAVLVGAGHLPWTVRLTVPLVVIAAIGHALLVPRYGAVGAALVTASTALIGATASCAATRLIVGTPIPFATLIRSVGVGGCTAWALVRLNPGGSAVLPVLAISVIVVAFTLVVSGELRPGERERIRALRRTAESPSVS